jgi:SAM-dependent methyltransferase
METKTLNKPWVPLGEAMMDFYSGNQSATIYIQSTIEGDRAVPVDVFFREKDHFPKLERDAFRYCRGKILDVGAGSGPHALFLKKKKFDVTPMDISEKAVEVMRQRGLQNALCADIFEYCGEKYDTILMMMNGIGVAGNLPNLAKLLQHLKTLLNPVGQILFDSTDISYVTPYDRSMSSLRIPFPAYYGTVYYQLEYKNIKGEVYPWLFIDKRSLKRIAEENGYTCDILKSKKSQYLASLKII